MFAYTMSTVADCAYRTADVLTITPRDEGAAVWRTHNGKRDFIGTILGQGLRTAAGVASFRQEDIEVGCVRDNGRMVGFRWTNGYYVAVNGGAEAHPPVLRREAYAMAREAGCKLIVMLG